MGLPLKRPSTPDAWEQPRGTPDLYERSSARLLPSVKRVLALLLVASVVTTAVGLLRYAPLMGAAPATASGATVEAEPDGDVLATYSPGEVFEYRFTVQNAGRWGVTITSVDPPAHPAIADARILAALPGSSSLAPLTSFALSPGASATIAIQVTFGTCKTPPPAGARPSWDHETVGFRVLGVARETAVALPMTVTIDDASAPRC